MAIDHSYLVSSFSAVKVDPATKDETPYMPDDTGAITVSAGDVIRFKDMKG